MARKQFIINYHTSGSTNPSTQDVQFGEIVVKHNSENPELLVKIDDSGTEKFAKFIDEAAVEGKVTANTSTISSNLQQLSGAVVNDYATSANTDSAISTLSGYAHSAIATAKSEAIAAVSGASSAYTDEQIETLETSLQGNIDGVSSNLQTLSGQVTGFSATVVSDYATSADTESAISTAKGEAIASASAYTDTQIGAVSGASSAYTDTKVASAFTGIETNRSNIQSLSGAVETFSANVETTINAKIASAYFVKGSKTDYTDLPDSGNVVGDVWNVVNASTVDGKYYPAGTNWVYTSDGWDALGGTIDVSEFATTATTDTISSNLQTLSGQVTGFSATVVSDYATSANTHSAIATAKSEAITAVSGASSAYTDAQISSFETSKLDPVKSRVGALEAISGATQTAVQTVAFSGATAQAQTASASGAKVAKVGTEIQLDFSELVIDGGEF